jgi:hypothetical protein
MRRKKKDKTKPNPKKKGTKTFLPLEELTNNGKPNCCRSTIIKTI